MKRSVLCLLSFLLLGSAVSLCQACDLAVDPITAVGIPGEEATLTDDPDNTNILIVDAGTEITLKAFWGVDKNANGKIEGSNQEWDDLSTAADPSMFANKKMGELTSRDTAFNIQNLLHSLFNPDPAGRIRGAHVTFNMDGLPGGESAVIKTPPNPASGFPFNPGSGDLGDYPVNTVSPEDCPLLENCFYVTPWDFFSLTAADSSGFVKDNSGDWVAIGGGQNPVCTTNKGDHYADTIRLVNASADDITCAGTPNWSVPTDAWGTDWDIDTSGTAFFPGRDTFIANNGGMAAVNKDSFGSWITTPGRSAATFSFATPTEPRCFFIQADGWFTFVLDNTITFKWHETAVHLKKEVLTAAPFNYTLLTGDVISAADIDDLKSKIKNADAAALTALAPCLGTEETYEMKMLVAIKKVGREARRQRFGRRKILVRDRVGIFWAGYGDNTAAGHPKNAGLPSLTLSDGALQEGDDNITVQFLSRNPYFDTALPTAPIPGVDATASEAAGALRMGESTFVPTAFAAELWILVQDVEKYQGVEGPLCKAYAADGKWGVKHGEMGAGGSCDCFAVPIPRFVWKRVDLVKPGGGGAVDIANFRVFRFRHGTKQGSGDLCDVGAYTIAQGDGSIPDGGKLQSSGETGELGKNAYFSVVEFDMPSDLFATHRPGLHYGPKSKEHSGAVKDILGRDMPGVSIDMPAWPEDEANLPLRYMVVVTNPGTGYTKGMARPDGSLCSGASDTVNEIPADMADLKQYVQGAGKRFLPRLAHHADTATEVLDGATAQIAFAGWAGNVCFPDGLPMAWGDASVGYGQYGHYTVVDDIKPELYLEVNTTYDGHFLFGDRRGSVCANREEFKKAANSKTGEEASGTNENYVLDDVTVFDNTNEEWIYNQGLDDPTVFQTQKALVADGKFCPGNFGFEMPSGWSNELPGLWVNEDTDLVFRVVARDNLNYYLPPSDSNPAGLDRGFVQPPGSTDSLHSHPETWLVHDGPRNKELRADAGGAEQGEAFPRYTFRKPNVPAPASGDGECYVEAEVKDMAGNTRRLRLNFAVFDTKSGYYQLEERRQKGTVDDTGSSDWWN